jgi:tRNA A-37 threonylcarbamoyl transferase component Bud32
MRLVRRIGIGYAVASFSRSCLIRLIDYPEMPMRVGAREVVKSGRSAMLVRTELPIGGRMTRVAYKCVRRKTWLKRVTVLVRTNRTLRTWRLGHELLRRNIATAKPLACVVPHRLNFKSHSYVAHEWIDGGRNLREWCWWAAGLPPVRHRNLMRRTAESLGQLLGHMHAQNVSHRDLKPGNLLMVDEGRSVRSYVIDLDGAALHQQLGAQTRLRNLSRLVIGLCELPPLKTTDALRFLKSYLAASGDTTQWKLVWRSLQSVSSARAERKRSNAA